LPSENFVAKKIRNVYYLKKDNARDVRVQYSLLQFIELPTHWNETDPTAGAFCFGWNNSFKNVLFQFHFSVRTV